MFGIGMPELLLILALALPSAAHAATGGDDDRLLETARAIDADGCINDREEAILRQWHKEDPVDDLERTRNNRVEGYQGNRNPFIDRPELVDRISNF